MNQILIRPLITEQSMALAGRGCFTFEVAVSANKIEVANEVAKMFNVHPTKVQTVIIKGQMKKSLRTRKSSRQANYKKAFVTVKPGEKIDVFDIGGEKHA